AALNPRAKINRGDNEGPDGKLLAASGSFDFEGAFSGAGWLRLMERKTRAREGHRDVAGFVYRSRRPFHPEKFSELTQRPFPGVFRAKGFFWLSTRMDAVGGLNVAGAESYLSPAGQWWAAHAHNHEIPDRIKKDWVEPFGDRR